VGEEVSHFYHPTPPPARNPSGFWRGVDDVLKMQEGTRKFADLFFTGHYEAPRDSWERAGYVLGEAIENRFTGGRVIGNVQKLERLGFFGKQVVSKTAVNDASSIDYQHLAKIHWDSLQEVVLDDKNDSPLHPLVVQVVRLRKNY
ncbi:MAG: hypothetical protein WCC83_02425, partial [Candidatus Rickettsiella isopodorum]